MYKTLLKNISDHNRKILILGAGVSGFAVAEFCIRTGIAAEVWDKAAKNKFLSSAENLIKYEKLSASGLSFKFADDCKEISADHALAVSSPGIPLNSDFHAKCNKANLTVISELELGLQLIRENSDCKHIVVTGSNGKSTTVSLISFVLKECDCKSALCGNIGKSALDLINSDFSLSDKLEYLVVEASSYQLEAFKDYRPDTAIMLNLTKNHLERHNTMDSYLLAKKRLIKNCLTTDRLIIPDRGDWLVKFISDANCQLSYFGYSPDSHAFINSEKACIEFKNQGQEVYEFSSGKLFGEHNYQNIAASLLALMTFNINLSDLIRASYKFMGLQHRLELLQSKKTIFNDSKATTVEATLAACKAIISSFDKKIILMLGGQQKKDSNWQTLNNFILDNRSKFDHIICFGESSAEIAASIGLEKKMFNKLYDAILAVKNNLNENNLLLFSPGCASFDEFNNFEERGEYFKSKIAA